MKRLLSTLVLLLATGACASSEQPAAKEHVGHTSAASIDDGHADNVFGQRDFDTGTEPVVVSALTVRRPAGLTTGALGGSIIVTFADRGNHRVRSLFGLTLTDAVPSFHLGQPSLDVGEANQGLGPSYATLSGPTAVAHSQSDSRYAVADTDNHRVLVGYFYSTPSWVLGQHFSFTTAVRNSGGLSNASLAEPKGVAWSSGSFATRLWIADSGNHRLLAYTDPSFGFATWVLGQHDGVGGDVFTRGEPNDGKGAPSSATLRDPRGLSASLNDFPGTASRGLYVADTGNHRVLHFDECTSLESSRPCPNADFVIGQKDFYTADPSAGGVTAFSLNTPTAVAIDRHGGVWVADTGHHRVLHFRSGSTKADRVLGQPDFETAAPPTAVSDQTLSAPTGVAVDVNDDVYVADTGSNRILRYHFIATTTSCDDGDPCTEDSVVAGRCQNVLTTFSKACFPYSCDTTRHVCFETCGGSFSSGTCQSPFFCSSSGRCAEPCSSPDAECRDGRKCVDGWCCDAACKGTCEACNVPGYEGTCTAVNGPPSSASFGGAKRSCTRPGLDDPECAGACDGRHRTACVPSSVTTACGPESCQDGVATLRGTCDGRGRCSYVKQACAPYACAPNGCRVDCTAPHHCVEGADCVEGRCVPASDQKIGGVGCNVRQGRQAHDRDRHVDAWMLSLCALVTYGLARRRRGGR